MKNSPILVYWNRIIWKYSTLTLIERKIVKWFPNVLSDAACPKMCVLDFSISTFPSTLCLSRFKTKATRFKIYKYLSFGQDSNQSKFKTELLNLFLIYPWPPTCNFLKNLLHLLGKHIKSIVKAIKEIHDCIQNK